MPAYAGIQQETLIRLKCVPWTPAYAGVTNCKAFAGVTSLLRIT